jgi:hypothetical protein
VHLTAQKGESGRDRDQTEFSHARLPTTPFE